jgi:nucleolar protein 15
MLATQSMTGTPKKLKLVVPSKGKKTRTEKKVRGEGKEKEKKVKGEVVLKGVKVAVEEVPKATTKKGKEAADESEEEVVAKSTPKAKKSSFKPQEPVRSSSPKAEVEPSDDGYIYGFTSDNDDSSDEDEDALAPELGVLKLPTISKDDGTVKRRLEQAKRHPVNSPSFHVRMPC